ncbi:MAG: nicotinate-nucleotide--dimethylbenzimidazole phosphoribosyltransferase, partial [Ruminococcus sp.]|nr:nicotinate-nucleotide--dimethylbenzimidazole phosphoribosyltransferase [Ruminococcus sp.]
MERIRHISRTNRAIAEEAKMNWDSIAKPLGSFGILEDMIIKIASIQETQHPDISKRIAVVMCGDHGVVAEGVTQCGSE